MQSPSNQQYLQQSPNQQYYSQQGNSNQSKLSFLSRLTHNRTLLIIIAVLQIIMIVLIINPAALWQQFQNQQIINEVASKTTVNSLENPVIATVTNADQLRDQNAAQAQVYKDAQNGDYVLGYSDKMIIYRRSDGTIVYEGDTPTGLVNNAQKKIVDDITSKAKELGLIEDNSTEAPQISIITDVKSLQAANPNFYSVARNNDIVALFPSSQLIVLYNQETATIVNSGNYSTNITSF